MSGPMPICRKVLEAGSWAGDPADIVVLDHDQRHRRRIVMTALNGLTFLLDLAEATHLRDGDGLELERGGIVRVEAAKEELAEISAPDDAALLRIAWYLGNRHCPTQLAGDRLLIRRDHVIEAMVEGLVGIILPVDAAFDPEGGAFGRRHHD